MTPQVAAPQFGAGYDKKWISGSQVPRARLAEGQGFSGYAAKGWLREATRNHLAENIFSVTPARPKAVRKSAK